MYLDEISLSFVSRFKFALINLEVIIYKPISEKKIYVRNLNVSKRNRKFTYLASFNSLQ